MAHDPTEERRENDDWTTIHDLAMVYLALAHGTDNYLSDEELDVMTQKLRAWDQKLDEADARVIVMEALVVYLEADRDDEVSRSMLAIRADMPLLQRFAALEDLTQIAEADGIVLENERGLIKALQRIWNLDIDAQA